ncbi:class I SAM-dependent methyltransferase [Microscilla marina]|uniref:Methyltransferase, putative n=1 Tax=Microscilla marina ATCC 23134 TaxID=313606 RepID=A2A020_MICM2|nr:class I SAM-dependent methyltransferase [Microscilla marina]EAY24015.1 methyltransferase, putative [Microscilla marina ATCC 23134]
MNNLIHTSQNEKTDEHFNQWFSSPYFHILYKHQNYQETQHFLDQLVDFLQPQPHHKLLDLACGKGKHAIYLSKKGLDMTGLDISENNLRYGQKFAHERLQFVQQDMREPYQENHFDFILNLFTSFGFYDQDAENQKVLDAVHTMLKPGGKFFLDFINPPVYERNLIPYELSVVQNIKFQVTQKVENGMLTKGIHFDDNGQDFHFEESIKLLSYDKFQEYIEASSLRLLQTLGGYDFSPFEEADSERMIFVLEK